MTALITPSGVTYEKIENPDYPTYLHCVDAGKAEATYRSNPTTKVKFSCILKRQK
jgi:hypothetical protein